MANRNSRARVLGGKDSMLPIEDVIVNVSCSEEESVLLENKRTPIATKNKSDVRIASTRAANKIIDTNFPVLAIFC